MKLAALAVGIFVGTSVYIANLGIVESLFAPVPTKTNLARQPQSLDKQISVERSLKRQPDEKQSSVEKPSVEPSQPSALGRILEGTTSGIISGIVVLGIQNITNRD